tara:strand:- start:284 stop:490 length:207 start_codon:yes stop_codon:yes gene_type:complete
MSDEEETSGAMKAFRETINRVNTTLIGLLGGITGIVIFISSYPAMPFLMVLSFMVAILKWFFYLFRRL